MWSLPYNTIQLIFDITLLP